MYICMYMYSVLLTGWRRSLTSQFAFGLFLSWHHWLSDLGSDHGLSVLGQCTAGDRQIVQKYNNGLLRKTDQLPETNRMSVQCIILYSYICTYV